MRCRGCALSGLLPEAHSYKSPEPIGLVRPAAGREALREGTLGAEISTKYSQTIFTFKRGRCHISKEKVKTADCKKGANRKHTEKGWRVKENDKAVQGGERKKGKAGEQQRRLTIRKTMDRRLIPTNKKKRRRGEPLSAMHSSDMTDRRGGRWEGGK